MDKYQQAILDTLFDSPDYYVRALEAKSKQFLVRQMRRQHYTSSVFLDDRLHTADDLYYLLPMQETLAHLDTRSAQARPVHFIFHFALCGSTLLSRCLDHPGHTMVYKEPELLHQIASHKRWRPDAGLPLETIQSFALACMQRTYSADEVPIVKLTDSCSNLVADCLAMHKEARAVVLFSTLERFLTATLKTDRRRTYIRGMYDRAVNDFAASGIELDPGKKYLSDGEVSAFVWLSLMFRFNAWLRAYPTRLRSLAMDTWMEHPETVLQSMSDYMGLNLPASLIQQTIHNGAFLQDAKATHLTFDLVAYQQKQQQILQRMQAEVSAARHWADRLMKKHPIQPELPAPLLPIS